MIDPEIIISNTVKEYLYDLQAIYLYGSYGTEFEHKASDIDIAVLLPPPNAKLVRGLGVSELRFNLEEKLNQTVDLINLRQVNTVFQKEIITTGRRIYCSDECAAEEFEMLVLSLYQKLNEERAEILQQALETGRLLAE